MKLIAKICLSLSIALLLSASFSSPHSLASSAVSISLVSDSGSYTVGDELTVWVKVSVTGGMAAAVEGNLEFDIAKLKFVSIQSTSDFDVSLEQTVDNNKIHLVRGKLGGFSGDATLYGVTLDALSSGTASFNLATSMVADSDGNKVTPQLSGLSLTINDSSSTGGTVTPPPETPADTTDNSDTGTSTPKKKTTSTVSNAGILNLSKSTVAFDKTSAIADGQDKICASVTLKNNRDKAVTNIKPEIKLLGGADATAISLNQSVWSSCLTSSMAGEKLVTLAVNNTTLQDKIVEFLLPKTVAAPATPTTQDTATTESPQQILSQKLSGISGQVSRVSGKEISQKSPINTKDLLEVSGQAEPGVSLKIYIYSSQSIVKDVTVGDDGSWSVKLDAPLPVGDHRLEASVVDKYGNESESKLLARFDVIKSSNLILYLSIAAAFILAFAVSFYLRKRSLKRLEIKGLPVEPAEPIDESGV